MVRLLFLSFFLRYIFCFLFLFLNADGLVTECVCGIFHVDDKDVSAFYAFQELFEKISHGRTQANSSVPRNPNHINLLILNPYLLLSGNDNNRENLENTDDIFVEKTPRDERLSNKVQTIRSNNLCATSGRKL